MPVTSNLNRATRSFLIALVLGTPFFIVFGALSDKIGRKYIMMAGMLIAVLAYRPIYTMMYNEADLKQKTEIIEQTNVSEPKVEVKGTDTVTTIVTKKTFTDGTTYKETKKETIPAGCGKES